MASPLSGTNSVSTDAPRREIPTHSLPTAREIRQQFYNEESSWPCILKYEAFEEANTAMNEPSNKTIDVSLFPYQADGHFNPPLPTMTEICEARPYVEPADKCEAWPVGSYMVKAAARVSILQEAENLLYLERYSTVRTPKVYAVFESDRANPFRWPGFQPGRTTIFYIIMEFIEGIDADSLFDEIGNKERIARDLGMKIGEQLRRLRAVEPEDPTHFGRIGGRPYPNLKPFMHPPTSTDGSTHGPFRSYEKCVTRLIHSAKVSTAISIGPQEFNPLTRYTYRDAPSIFLDYPKPIDRRPVLSHLDLQDHNIIVKVKRDDKGQVAQIEEVVLIDWSTMCWMPSWYEPGDLCYSTTATIPEFRRVWAYEALETMGYINVAIVFFFAHCVHSAFKLEHF